MKARSDMSRTKSRLFGNRHGAVLKRCKLDSCLDAWLRRAGKRASGLAPLWMDGWWMWMESASTIFVECVSLGWREGSTWIPLVVLGAHNTVAKPVLVHRVECMLELEMWTSEAPGRIRFSADGWFVWHVAAAWCLGANQFTSV